MVIDCDSCEVAGLACQDCVVSVLLGLPETRIPAEAGTGSVVELDDEHARAVQVLADSGLVPPLRLYRSAG